MNSSLKHLAVSSVVFAISTFSLVAQVDTIVLGQGNDDNIVISTSSQTEISNAQNTTSENGFLPNLNKSSRFLSQATLGHNYDDIIQVADEGIEDWLDAQLELPRGPYLLESVRDYVRFAKAETGNLDINSSQRMWKYAWWQYHMSSPDAVRQRMALALSEILVVSSNSSFSNNGYALADYYDIFLNHGLGNYRDIMEDVTFHAAMGVYLTFLNNPKTDLAQNRFPDENYARELMQLFTIGLYELNNDGSRKTDDNGDYIPTYDNEVISEFAKVFTGLSWADRPNYFKNARRDTSYIAEMIMFNDYHEPGEKFLLNGAVVPNRDPVDGMADIQDALDNLFNHPNLGPFVCKLLIQRLVTSNPSPAYIDRVASIFNDNGEGIRGDLKAVAKAILLDPVALDCSSGDDVTFGMLREPFIRYFQINKAFYASTSSGIYRNDMDAVSDYVEQLPLASPSVFNFFQPDYQPLGEVSNQDLVAPEFQITDAKTLAGYINGVYRWVVQGNIADEYDIYGGEPDSTYTDQISEIDLAYESMFTADDELHILLDRLNLVLAQGRLSDQTEQYIIQALKEFPNETPEEQVNRARMAIYFTMSAPEYLINR